MGKVIIIGAGPAGISASLYTARAGLDTTVIAMGTGSLNHAEKIENYYGMKEPLSGQELAENGVEGAKKLGVKFLEDEVVGIGYESSLVVETVKGKYAADGVILATGSSRVAPNIEGIKELEGKGVSYCAICDAFFYRGKNVCILGNGRFALNEAAALLPVVSQVTLLTNGLEVEADFPDGIVINKNKIKKIEGEDRVNAVMFENGETLETSGVFIAYGVAGSTALAKKIGAKTVGNKIVVDENMKTNIPGLYAAGDCTGGLLQVVKAVYEGAQAGISLAKEIHNKEK